MQSSILSFLLLLLITFWFEGHTLYWADGNKKDPSYYLQFQMDKTTFNPKEEIYPEINKDPIIAISVGRHKIDVYTHDKKWTVFYDQDPRAFNWYVTDWRYYE